ncbi:hypothetical protein YC2023_084128 [Brassica napus]
MEAIIPFFSILYQWYLTKAAEKQQCLPLEWAQVPQIGIPGVCHLTFESLRLGRSSQSITSNLLASGIP